MSERVALVAGILVTLTGCYLPALKHQAALDHNCSEDRVVVLRAADESGRPTEVDVCGKVRRYRVMGTNEMGAPVWLDVTDLVPGSSTAPDTKSSGRSGERTEGENWSGPPVEFQAAR